METAKLIDLPAVGNLAILCEVAGVVDYALIVIFDLQYWKRCIGRRQVGETDSGHVIDPGA